ncbi:MAG: hypothetical protein V1895_01530 [Parcubacteria group bacterium]
MKSLLTLYTGDDWGLKQPVMTNGLDRAYAAWGRVMKKRKNLLTRASIQWYHQGRFTRYWQYDWDANYWHKVRKPLRPSGIYDKARTYNPKAGEHLAALLGRKHEIADSIRMVNLPQFSELVDNKLNQAVIFNQAMPASRLWMSGSRLKNPRGKRIVLKALGGSGGTYVKITRRKYIAVRHLSIQQEFIEATKNGLLRDIRICFIGDKAQYVYSRVARPGSLYTNVHMGATMEFMKLSEIKDLLKLCDKLMQPLRVFPKKIMSFDFLIDVKKNRPFLVETNTMPGTNNFSDALLERFFSNITSYVLED